MNDLKQIILGVYERFPNWGIKDEHIVFLFIVFAACLYLIKLKADKIMLFHQIGVQKKTIKHLSKTEDKPIKKRKFVDIEVPIRPISERINRHQNSRSNKHWQQIEKEYSSEEQNEKSALNDLSSPRASSDSEQVKVLECEAEKQKHTTLSLLDNLVKKDRIRIVYVGYGMTAADLMDYFTYNEYDTSLISIVDCISCVSGAKRLDQERIWYVENPSMLEEAALYLERAITKGEYETHVIVDSIPSILIYNEENSCEQFLQTAINRAKKTGSTALIISSTDKRSKKVVEHIESLIDKIVRS